MDILGSNRSLYRPSGRIDILRFLTWLPLLIAAGMAVALGYYGMLWAGFYIAFLSTAIFIIFLGWIAGKFIRATHCRNPWLAGVFGMACGLAGYFGYFGLDLCLRWEAPPAAIAKLPDFVAFRLATDRLLRKGEGFLLQPQAPAAAVQPFLPLRNVNWMTWNGGAFALDVLLLAGGPFIAAMAIAGRPYSEKRRQWYSHETLILSPEAGKSLEQALINDTLEDWITSNPRRVGLHEPHKKMRLWYLPAETDRTPEIEVYIDLDSRKPQRLSTAETAALTRLFPGLSDIAGPAMPQMADAAWHSRDTESAQVWQVPPPYAGQTDNRWNDFLGISLFFGLLIIGGLLPPGVLVGGTMLLTQLIGNQPFAWIIVFYVVPTGIAAVIFLRYLFNPEHNLPLIAMMRFNFRLLRRSVRNRPDALVAADHPQLIFAEMAPRRFWESGNAKRGDTEKGLLLIDHDSKVLLFEGNYHRYWIPAESIISCDVEALTNVRSTTAGFFCVVVRVRLGTSEWEFPFFPLLGIAGANRWEKTTALLEELEDLCGHDFDVQPSAPPRDPGIHAGV